MSLPDGYEAVIGLEIHVQLSTRTKMFCGCELSFGDRAERPHLPGLPGPPGRSPGDQRAGRPLRAADRAGAGVRGRAAVDLPPQELLLSRTTRRATRSASTTFRWRSGGRLGDVRIHRVHLEEDAAKLTPRRRIGADPRLRHLAGRLQPRRHAPGRDRHRARPARPGRGAGVGAAPANHGQAARRLRREHGGGEPALRRQRLGAAPGRRGAGDEDRAQEHEQLPLPGAGHRRRAGAPGRGARGRGARSSRRPSTSIRGPGR